MNGLPVPEAAKVLNRSRRQLDRYIAAGCPFEWDQGTKVVNVVRVMGWCKQQGIDLGNPRPGIGSVRPPPALSGDATESGNGDEQDPRENHAACVAAWLQQGLDYLALTTAIRDLPAQLAPQLVGLEDEERARSILEGALTKVRLAGEDGDQDDDDAEDDE
ncbi:hypothetical protein ACFL59_05320 [Planctomycetota bacterium]